MACESLHIKEQLLRNVLAPIEPYIISVQSFLIWEKPHLSIVVLFLVHIVFWLSSFLAFYQLVALVGAASVCLDLALCQLRARSQSFQPSQDESFIPVHPTLLSVPEISRLLAQWWLCVDVQMATLRILRQSNWNKFSAVCIVFFSVTLIVGYYIPGIYLTYAACMCVLLGPGALHHNIPQRLGVLLGPLLVDAEKKLGIKRQTDRKEDLRMVDSEADLLREFAPQLDADAPPAAIDSSTDDDDDDHMGLASQAVSGDVSDSDDEVGPFAQGLMLPSVLDPLMQSDASLVPSQTQLYDEEDGLQRSINFDARHFKDSTIATDECDEDKLAAGLTFPDVRDILAGDGEPAAAASSASATTAVATAALMATAEALTDGSQRLLGHLQQNVPVAKEYIYRGSAALASSAYTGITVLSDVVKNAAATMSANERDASTSDSSLIALDDESIDKEFEFLNEDELTETEHNLLN